MFILFEQRRNASPGDAKWNDKHSCWYWEDEVLEFRGTSTIHAPFYEVHSSLRCWKCHEITPVVTLGVHKAFDHNVIHGMEYSHPMNVLLCYEIRQLPDDIITHFCQYKYFGLVFTKNMGKYWGARCEKCGVVQGETFLYNSPGAFNSYSYSDNDSGCVSSENRHVKIISGIEGSRIISARFTTDDEFQRPE